MIWARKYTFKGKDLCLYYVFWNNSFLSTKFGRQKKSLGALPPYAPPRGYRPVPCCPRIQGCLPLCSNVMADHILSATVVAGGWSDSVQPTNLHEQWKIETTMLDWSIKWWNSTYANKQWRVACVTRLFCWWKLVGGFWYVVLRVSWLCVLHWGGTLIVWVVWVILMFCW